MIIIIIIIIIQRVRYVKAEVMPVITGDTVTIPKSLRQYLINIPGKHEITNYNKNSHTGRCTHTAVNKR